MPNEFDDILDALISPGKARDVSSVIECLELFANTLNGRTHPSGEIHVRHLPGIDYGHHYRVSARIHDAGFLAVLFDVIVHGEPMIVDLRFFGPEVLCNRVYTIEEVKGSITQWFMPGAEGHKTLNQIVDLANANNQLEKHHANLL